MVSASVPTRNDEKSFLLRQPLMNKLTRVVGTANGNLHAELVLSMNTTSALNAKLLGECGISKVELAILTLETTNGLAGRALSARPLRLLITSGASVRAHGSVLATVTTHSSDNIGHKTASDGYILNTGPATELQVVKCDGTIVGWESIAVNLSIREVGIQALSTRAARLSGGARGSSGRRGY